MKLLELFGVLAVASALCAVPALGHGGCHHGSAYHGCDGCWGDGCQGCAQWQVQPAPRSEAAPRSPRPAPAAPSPDFETVQGTIAEVIYLPGVNPDSGIVEVVVAAGEQKTLARLAPAGFLQQHKVLPKEGEEISLTGYRVRTADGDAIVAVEVRMGDRELALRNVRGRGLW